MRPVNYFAHLETLISDGAAIEREKERLDAAIGEMSGSIRRAISENTVPGLIWHLASKELDRIRPLVSIPVSDFAGQARYLRALAAATPFVTAEIGDDPGTDSLLEACRELWQVLFFREMMDDLKTTDTAVVAKEKGRIAALMSLLDALQLEGAYIDQAEARIRALYDPFSSEIIEPKIGLTVEEVVTGFGFLREEIARRVNNAEELMQPMVREWQSFRQLPAKAAQRQLRTLKRPDPRREIVATSFREGIDLYNHFLIVTPDNLQAPLGNRALAFLKTFSFTPGEVNLDLNTPFDMDAVRARPLARLSANQFMLFDPLYASFAPLYRLEECFGDGKHRQRMHRQRDLMLEDDAARFLAPVVGPTLQLRNYYLPVGKTGELAERDLLLFRDGVLLLVESKAKPLRPVAGHRGNVRKIESDIKESIHVGYEQACSVWRHITACESEVVFLNSNKAHRKELARLDPKEVRKVYVIVVVDSSYGLVGTDLAPWLVPDEGIGFPWVVNRDTLELIVLKIDTFEKLTSFLEWRRDVHGKVFDDDEAVIAGFFVRHGPAPLGIDGGLQLLVPEYTDVFEYEYLQRKGIPVGLPSAGSDAPVIVSMRREGNRIIQEMGGKILDSFDMFGVRPDADTVNGGRGKPKRPHVMLRTTIDSPNRPAHVGRNDLCPCGSGFKFKRCCLKKSR